MTCSVIMILIFEIAIGVAIGVIVGGFFLKVLLMP